MLNLIDLLPEEDKILMEKYIYLYGVGEKDFIGLDKYLKYWAESKKKLYKLLGNNFQLEIPYCHEKTEYEMKKRFCNLLDHSFMEKFTKVLKEDAFKEAFDEESLVYLYNFFNSFIYNQDKTEKMIKFKSKANGKDVKLQAGMKPIRALQRIVNSFPELFSEKEFEDFRIKHSLCLNDKYIKGTLVLSIHPFDFITMSDNDSDWSSCMSWMGEGCYHMGTIEMMNSNNVICAYIKSSSKPFIFDKKNNLEWNNKKWRQLIYFNKDIIVSGKPYPYCNKELSLTIIKELKKLAENNLSWTYTFGPELYRDMIHINGKYSMDRNRSWLKNNDSFKHNILFDTKGMYNDILNCNSVDYWCYRNKVKKMKIISVSGKGPCACCGEDALYENDWSEEYNDRYEDPERIVCYDCNESGICDSCGKFFGRKTLISLKGKEESGICPNCAKDFLIKCPCCDEYFSIKDIYWGRGGVIRLTNQEIFYNDIDYCCDVKNYLLGKDKISNEEYLNMKVIPAFICPFCLEKDAENPNGFFKNSVFLKDPESPVWWSVNQKNYFSTKKVYTKEEIENDSFLSKIIFKNIQRYKEDKNFD